MKVNGHAKEVVLTVLLIMNLWLILQLIYCWNFEGLSLKKIFGNLRFNGLWIKRGN